MVKLRSGAVLVVMACHAEAPPAKKPAAEVARPSPIQVEYRPLANVFEIMDNVTEWWKAKNDPEYREWWDAHTSMSPEDEKAFATYVERRRESFPKDQPPPALFPSEKPVDWLARAFYESATLDEATGRMRGHIPDPDIAFFRSFYETYQRRLGALHVLDESQAFVEMARATNQSLANAGAYAESVVHAYGQTEVPGFTAVYVWWPPAPHTTANPRGQTLLLKYNPKAHASDAARAGDIVVHEFAHVVSSRRAPAEREALAKTFSAGCATETMKPVSVLEEPLAVVMQKRYLRATDPSHFDVVRPWYGDPWVSAFAKQLLPIFDAHPRVDEAFIQSAAQACAELQARGPAP